ncbi:iron-sulfur cluster co-chaperone protein HscB homolog isoform X2 [Cornus florida]|uniref:iron-sulfur cluster co-chaperone protein HscB homolog isoform X2 n=1 Tax=Cornus florida TaxID=4283 RepID=UPI0028A01B2D|nr:iron-sulfur cluster co-chaperone protein HscB homolog isoform X2 [Cornus florida]
MWRKKLLWTTLSSALRRALPSTSRFSINSIHVTQFSTAFSSTRSFHSEEDPRVFPIQRYWFLGNLKFSGKNFCSERVLPRCWNCDAVPQVVPFLFCDSCRSIQPVDRAVDYFQIFGLEKKYYIDDRNLEGRYKDWQKKLHPDLVHSKSEKERGYAAEQSARVIDAYRTLTNPLSRAIYILKLEGVDVDEEETVSDIELLAEILEIREAVEEATDSQALNKIQAQVRDDLVSTSAT